MSADWAVVVSTLGASVLILAPTGRRLGIWLGSDDPTAGGWQRFYGRPGLGFYVVGATHFAVGAGWALLRERPWLAALWSVFVMTQLLGCAMHVHRRRQERTPRIM